MFTNFRFSQGKLPKINSYLKNTKELHSAAVELALRVYGINISK